MTPVELKGLDGRNLLAFLAALGTHIALDCKTPGVRLSWDARTFRPTIHVPLVMDVGSGDPFDAKTDRVVDLVQRGLAELASPHRFPWENLKRKGKGLPRSEFRQKALEPAAEVARGQKADRRWADFVAGLASDAAGSAREIKCSALCVITGDSRQDFLGFMRTLCKDTTPAQLRAALFAPWNYEDKGRSFRWDSSEDRRYALRASDPSKGPDKKIPSMWGANRLALEALACLPCHPRGRRLQTTGFQEERVFHWPLWDSPVTLATLRALLAHPAVLDSNATTLAAMGVFAIASSRRTLLGRKRTFGPASIWPVRTSARQA